MKKDELLAVEVSEDKYWDMLGALPPLRMGKKGFLMSEFITGSFTEAYFKKENKFYCQAVNYLMPSTWKDLIN